MRVALYKRVSSKKQREGSSLEEQDRALREYAARMGWTITAEYQETHSSWTGQRDQFETMRQAAREGQFERILVWALDRFGRRSGQLHSVIEELAGLGVYLVLVHQGVDLSAGGIGAKAILSALALAADLENEVRSERTSAVMAAKSERGLFAGKLPTGYRYAGKFVPAAIDEKAAAGIREAFRVYATGEYSIIQLAERLNAAGHRMASGQPYAYRGLQRILHNRRYTGMVECGGEWVEAREPALVSCDLFEAVQRILSQRGEARRSMARVYHGYLLTGILYCVCGAKMYGQRVGRKRQPAYRCRATYLVDGGCPDDGSAPAYLDEAAISPRIDELIARLRLLPSWRERIVDLLAGRDERRQIDRQRRAFAAKIERAKELYLEGLLERAAFDRLRREAQAELARLVPSDEVAVLNAGAYLENLPLLWEAATVDERHAILKSVFARLVVDRPAARIVEVEVRPEFVALFRQMDGEYTFGAVGHAEAPNTYSLSC